MQYFVDLYLPKKSKVLDVGGVSINGSYASIIEQHDSVYKTLDWDEADYVVHGYDWKDVPTDFDAIITGQTFEHDGYFWKTLENIKNTVKRGGLVIIIVPSKGRFHQYPLDCYRFNPDSAKVFAEILNAKIIQVVWNSETALDAEENASRGGDCKVCWNFQQDTKWGDLGMVFKIK